MQADQPTLVSRHNINPKSDIREGLSPRRLGYSKSVFFFCRLHNTSKQQGHSSLIMTHFSKSASQHTGQYCVRALAPPLPRPTNSDLEGLTEYESQKAYGNYMGLRSRPTFIGHGWVLRRGWRAAPPRHVILPPVDHAAN